MTCIKPVRNPYLGLKNLLVVIGDLTWLFHAFGDTDSSFVPPLVYAMMGSSRDLAVGTVAVASLLTGAMLSKDVNPNENLKLYVHLAFTATFFAGVFEASLGLLR